MPAAAAPHIAPAKETTTPPTAAPTGAEAQGQITALLRAARSKVPVELLAPHLMQLHGDAGFVVLLAAAEAVARRLQIVAEERLRVLQRPRSGVSGDYRTGLARNTQRPYRTQLRSVEPLCGSCDCPDFRGNSLGLCKHLLAVLADLARHPRLLQRARLFVASPRDQAELRLHPVKPLLGNGDWLQQVELHLPPPPLRVQAPWTTLRRRFSGKGNPLHLLATHRSDPRARLQLLDELQAALATDARGGDAALAACIADERTRLQVATTLQPLRPRAAMRGFKRTLFPYQHDGVARFLQTGRLLLADDMGLGKTTQAAACCWLLSRHGLVQRGLLVVPASLKPQWVREWHACSDLPITEVEGDQAQRARCYRTTRRGFLLTNYEQLLRDLEHAQRWQPELVLLDEAQRMKNWESRTAATIKQLTPPFRLVLTGTPFENRVLELDSILEWLDRRPLQPQWRLLPFHELPDGQGMRHLDVLRQRLEPVLLRRRRQEVLDQLPGRADTRIDVPITAAQRSEHEDRELPIAQLLAISARRPLLQAEFLRLMLLFTEQRIIANGMAQFAFDEVWPGIHNARPEPALLDGLSMPKLAELRLLLQQVVVAQGRKVVVFSQWRRALQLAAWAMGPLLADAGVRCTFFTGAQSPRARTANLVAFHDDPAMRVLFATDAGGIGLNLQHAASCCVHFDLPWNPAVFEQRVGRIWRLGQKHKVEVYSLVAEDCIESRIWEILGNKQATFRALFDSSSDEVRFERAGGFLAVARSVAAPARAAARVAAQVEDKAKARKAPAPAPIAGGNDGEDERLRADTGALDAATMRGRAALTATPPQPKPTRGPDAEPRERPDAAQVRRLLAGLSVQPRSDGGMLLEADRESAAVLADVLRALAGVIDGAVGRGA